LENPEINTFWNYRREVIQDRFKTMYVERCGQMVFFVVVTITLNLQGDCSIQAVLGALVEIGQVITDSATFFAGHPRSRRTCARWSYSCWSIA
jgi:hypothetical protein